MKIRVTFIGYELQLQALQVAINDIKTFYERRTGGRLFCYFFEGIRCCIARQHLAFFGIRVEIVPDCVLCVLRLRWQQQMSTSTWLQNCGSEA